MERERDERGGEGEREKYEKKYIYSVQYVHVLIFHVLAQVRGMSSSFKFLSLVYGGFNSILVPGNPSQYKYVQFVYSFCIFAFNGKIKKNHECIS